MPGALDGVRVLDLSRALAGPYCTLMLGDMGADVVKVEQPGSGDESRLWGPPFRAGESSYYLSVNRNKRSVTLDLKDEADLASLRALVQRADVLVENFRPGTLARFGLDYEVARSLNLSLVYCSISGFGQTGPRAHQPAYDAVLQGMGGVQGLTGETDGAPMRVGVPIADITAGMFAAYAVVAALFARERDPDRQGQQVDTSLLASQVALLTYQAGRYFATGAPPSRTGNGHATIAPYQTYASADGYVNVSCGNQRLWERFCRALGCTHVLHDRRFASNPDRVAHLPELNAVLEPLLRSLSTEEIVSRLSAQEVPVGPVLTVPEVFADPQVAYAGLAQPTPHPLIPDLLTTGFPYLLSETPPSTRRPPPQLGEHTQEILAELRGAGWSSTPDSWTT